MTSTAPGRAPGRPVELNRELTRIVESLRILYEEWDKLAGTAVEH